MVCEYLPVLEIRDEKILVKGRIDRIRAHCAPPALHATSVIAAVLPDGRLLLADKTQKQRKKGRLVPDGGHVYDCFGGHMTYQSIPEEELREGLRMETFLECAYRELSEELLRVTSDGSRIPFTPDKKCLIPIGRYSIENGHNREYSWGFLYVLPDFGPYTSEDTLLKETSFETIFQPVIAVTWEELCESYLDNGSGGIIISDGIGRMLAQNNGAELYECIKKNRGGL